MLTVANILAATRKNDLKNKLNFYFFNYYVKLSADLYSITLVSHENLTLFMF